MYWPIGAPRIYAASNSQAPKDRVLEFDDDAESRETTEGSGELLDVPSTTSDGGPNEDNRLHLGHTTPLTPTTPGIKPVEHDAQGRLSTRLLKDTVESMGNPPVSADKEPILALRVSRIGHLFAVITSTSLTIWQTKVC